MCNFQYQSALREGLKFVQPEASLPEPLSSVTLWQQTEQREGRGIMYSSEDNVVPFRSCDLSRSLVFGWVTVPT